MKFIVRELHQKDLDHLYRLMNNPEIAYLTNHMIDTYEDFIEKYQLYIEGKAIDLKIFVILIDESIVGKIELGYDLSDKTGIFEITIGNKQFWGKGIAPKALQVLFAYGFNNLRLNKISCEVLGFNLRSLKFMEKNGLHLDGILRQDRFINQQFVDVYIYSKLKSEFEDFD